MQFQARKKRQESAPKDCGYKYMAEKVQIELAALHLHRLNQQMPVGFQLEQRPVPSLHLVTLYLSAGPRPKR